jgi:hypothetical protein
MKGGNEKTGIRVCVARAQARGESDRTIVLELSPECARTVALRASPVSDAWTEAYFPCTWSCVPTTAASASLRLASTGHHAQPNDRGITGAAVLSFAATIRQDRPAGVREAA